MNRPATSALNWSGSITFAPMISLFSGVGGTTARHQSVSHKVVIGAPPTNDFDRLQAHNISIVIPANVRHQIDLNGRNTVMAFLDARHYSLKDAHALADRWSTMNPDTACTDSLREDIADIAPRILEQRITKALNSLEQAETIREAAGNTALSESRFTHLISDALGAPPQTWRIWLRIRRAIDYIADGQDVTTAASNAGFADASHFSRSCVAHLGIRPSIFQNDSNSFIRSNEKCESVLA